MGDANPICTLGDYSKPRYEGYRYTIELLKGNNVVPLRSDTIRRTIDQSDGGKLYDRNAKESWELLEDLALYDNESWNDPKDFTKPVKTISLPQDVPSTSDCRFIELDHQVQRLMEAYIAPIQPTQVNKITSSCKICSGPHDTQYCMGNPEQAFVEYASSRTNKAGPGSENRPSMLNKENYVPWSSRLLRYAKSRPNGKLIYNAIINGPYIRRMIPKPGDTNREVTVNETFHVQTDDELTEKELKQIEANDQAIQTILLGLPEDIYATVDSCETAQEIWLRVQQMMKGSDIGIQEKKAKLFNEWERFTSNDGESIESYYHRFLKLMNDLKRNKHFPKKIASNLKFLNNLQPEYSQHVTIVHQTKDLHTADYTQLQITQPSMNMGQDRHMQMVGGNGENQFRQYVGQNVGNMNRYNVVQNYRNQVAQNPRVQNARNQNGQIDVSGNANQNGNGNIVAARAEGNATRHNGIQLQAEEFDLMASAPDLDEIKEVNANYILMANLQQALTSGTQTDKAPVYDSDGSAEVHEYKNCYDNEIFNMFTQEEQYTELPEPIPEPL
nr:Gag-Pol polyprotein [Tanacetum cinerariifolium]